ncbi:unnamed protein product [Linum trigynum]|uniref:Uncharacterized protein n=1 Tax=Linum trigynum TaxID=586398 RepID=A0AAV2EZC8_9ROSI
MPQCSAEFSLELYHNPTNNNYYLQKGEGRLFRWHQFCLFDSYSSSLSFIHCIGNISFPYPSCFLVRESCLGSDFF